MNPIRREKAIQEFLDSMARSMSNLDQIEAGIQALRAKLDEQEKAVNIERQRWLMKKRQILKV